MTSDETPTAVDLEARRSALVQHLRTRLAAVCAGWPPELFTSMVERLADITMRYDTRTSTTMYDRRSTDRLLADMKEAIERNVAARQDRDSGAHRGPAETD